jgi:drug/metabolite transporter (DMT)-like permease
LLTTVVSLLALPEALSAQAAAGVAVLGTGVILMSMRGHAGAGVNRGAIGFALLTAVTISGYTLVDGTGARTAGDPSAYAATLFVIDGLPLPLFMLWRRGPATLLPLLRYAGQGLAGGAMSLGSYWIAIWAMTLAPIAIVAALRETSVLFSTVIATLVLKEEFRPVRGAAAVLIVGGLLLIRWQ